jgi:hypothetical protein
MHRGVLTQEAVPAHGSQAQVLRQFFKELIEASAVCMAHVDECDGHALVSFDILDDRSGAHFTARHVEYDLHDGAQGRWIGGGDK